MNQQTFIQEIQKAGVPALSRFLAIQPQDVVILIQSGAIEGALDVIYQQMPEEELSRFERELVSGEIEAPSAPPAPAKTGIAPTDREPVWAEIRNDHFEEADYTGGFTVAYIDAWKTGNDDEEGVVIANVIGAVIGGVPKTYVSYRDPQAMVDQDAQDAIAEAEKNVLANLEQITTESQPVIRRTRIDTDNVITVYITEQKPGQKDNRALVRITTLRSQAGCVPEPVVDRLTTGWLNEDINQAIQDAIRDLKTEPAYF